MQISVSRSKLTFVYIGERLPRYVFNSLKIAKVFSGQDLQIIANKHVYKHLKMMPVEFCALEDFYNPEIFLKADGYLTTKSHFRNGLWQKSLERFFVLEQFMSSRNLDYFLHAELDQLLFRTDLLTSNLLKIDRTGVFLPFHGSKSAVASVFFCNSSSALGSMLEFSQSGVYYPNEMNMIAQWAQENPTRVHELPTFATEVAGGKTSNVSSISLTDKCEIGGLVDAAQLGQWFAGIDPRNVPIRSKPLNKFCDIETRELLSRDQLTQVKLNLNATRKSLELNYYNEYICDLYNLHIHSKVHTGKMASIIGMSDFVGKVNMSQPISFKGTRMTQVLDFLLFRINYVQKNPVASLKYISKEIKKFLSLHS